MGRITLELDEREKTEFKAVNYIADFKDEISILTMRLAKKISPVEIQFYYHKPLGPRFQECYRVHQIYYTDKSESFCGVILGEQEPDYEALLILLKHIINRQR